MFNQRIASQIAQTIIIQLGGAGKLRMLLGAKDFVLLPDGVEIHIAKSPKGVSLIRIVATSRDLYDLTFYGPMNSKTYTRKIKSVENDVYIENLISIVEHHTGAYLNIKGRTANSNIQEDIINILGGMANIDSITGGSRVLPTSGGKGIIFAIPYVRGQGVTHIKIVLNDMGNYDVTFFAPMVGTTPKIKKFVKDTPANIILPIIKKYAYLSF